MLITKNKKKEEEKEKTGKLIFLATMQEGTLQVQMGILCVFL